MVTSGDESYFTEYGRILMSIFFCISAVQRRAALLTSPGRDAHLAEAILEPRRPGRDEEATKD